MHVHGDAAGAALDFSAWQQRVGELAWITDAAVLERELAAAVRFAPHVTPRRADVAGRAGRATAKAAPRPRASARRRLRAAAYGQRAIAARLIAPRRIASIARQWFRSPDVLALLPFDRPQAERSLCARLVAARASAPTRCSRSTPRPSSAS